MTALTIRQRDLLAILIRADNPLRVDNLTEDLGLPPHEVSYGLMGIRPWSLNHN